MTLLLLLLAVTTVGIVATPGLAAAALLIVPLAVLVVAWWAGLAAATRGRPAEGLLIRVRHHELLGPGGPDDQFAHAAPRHPNIQPAPTVAVARAKRATARSDRARAGSSTTKDVDLGRM